VSDAKVLNDREKKAMISIVVPVFNERETILELYARIRHVTQAAEMNCEILFVNDGSTDQSEEILLNLCRKDQSVKVLELSRNFGHQIAIAAGLDYAQGDAVITMDADLQHPPELIPELVKKWTEDFDVIYTCRRTTQGVGPFKILTSRFFYSLINRLSDVTIPAGAADFRLLDRKVVEVFRTFRERSLFVRGLIAWMGYRQTAILYEAGNRYGGKSKYSFGRMLRLFADGITSFSSVPLYLSALFGAIISAFSFVYAGYAIYARLFTGSVVEGWTSVLVMVSFIGGIQLITLGILGLYLGRIYNEVKGRPRYLLRHTIGLAGKMPDVRSRQSNV